MTVVMCVLHSPHCFFSSAPLGCLCLLRRPGRAAPAARVSVRSRNQTNELFQPDPSSPVPFQLCCHWCWQSGESAPNSFLTTAGSNRSHRNTEASGRGAGRQTISSKKRIMDPDIDAFSAHRKDNKISLFWKKATELDKWKINVEYSVW